MLRSDRLPIIAEVKQPALPNSAEEEEDVPGLPIPKEEGEDEDYDEEPVEEVSLGAWATFSEVMKNRHV